MTVALEELQLAANTVRCRAMDAVQKADSGHQGMHLSGLGVSIEDLQQFRQLHSKTPRHPEHGHTPGVETTTGPLGQGFGNAVGMAIASQIEAARFHNPSLIPRVFVTVGEGDLMESVTSEAASLAGHLQLGNLICLFDDNGLTIEGHTELATSDDVAARFAACGWQVQQVDGHDTGQALKQACAQDERPQLIACRTLVRRRVWRSSCSRTPSTGRPC